MVDLPVMKPCEFIGSARDDLSVMPPEVKRSFGFAIRAVVEDFDGDTYRAVYTVKFAGMIYVLHAFKKKSKKGSKTPQPDMRLIASRLKTAQDRYDALTKKKPV